MKALPALGFVTLLAFGMVACNGSDPAAPLPDTHDNDVKALADTEAQWNKDYLTKLVESVTLHYVDDAVLIAPGAPPARGKEAIRKAVRDMLADSDFHLEFQPSRIEVSKSGELGYTVGTYTLTSNDDITNKIVTDHGSYVKTYRKQADDSWKAVVEIATSERSDK